ncbi:tripartite tricarboxylate transporter TctB family protein [Nitrincola iocasae]|uniref:Tripartite tricarboxylate transporter TctB family protein n=1 Tax=Nitrincola iocasae TaxID=2614693 RepID=A0A5J6LH02_9GAMM|nr:tripartite tricarboxylate transporter TctB family protein [Nitrincola iocasae]QEW07897.1 tripartite tricarboxylate transporter TctB family protein [Nitrincola iocasae]
MIKLDRILGLILFTLAIAYGWGAFHFPVAFAGPESVGPSTFPKILSVIVATCSLYMMVKPDDLQEGFEWRALPELAITLTVLVLYVFLMEPIGFIVATALMVSILCWRMGVKPLPAMLTGVVASSFVFLLFHFGLALPLPIGPWEV